jgi:hypothetical protein
VRGSFGTLYGQGTEEFLITFHPGDLNVDAFIEAQRCFAGTPGFTSRVDSGVSISAAARNKEREISCCCERRGCSEQVGTFIEAAGSLGGAAHSLRF